VATLGAAAADAARRAHISPAVELKEGGLEAFVEAISRASDSRSTQSV
jgi:hypothetical protein